ncbi:MAG: family transcriptional regulator, cyclic receptor protein [Solirubrobacterales bacterium]|jgi:CRP/FNR family transcriptional regulator|nr:family transcriptional regulator, cyclic receptor protein [Solirubrobacterales bacterium]
MSDALEMLSRVPLFAGVQPKALAKLVDRMSERTFAEGETALEEGRGGAGFWLIESGDANVSVAGSQVRTLGPGDYFGEIALIDDGPRSATVVAATDLRCRGIAAWEFKAFVGEHPDAAWAIMETLAKRLREAEARET